MAFLRNPAEKLVVPALLLVVGAFLLLGAVSIWTTWRDAKALMISLQREKAETAAQKIYQYFAMVQHKFHPITQNQAPEAMYTSQQQYFEYLRMFREIPEIREMVPINAEGQSSPGISPQMHKREPADYSREPLFIEARKHGTHVGPTFLSKESEPYVFFAMAHATPHSGVTLAQLRIKWLWDLIDSIKVGATGYAYVVDERGRLIATRDKAQMLRNLQGQAALRFTSGWTPDDGKTFDGSPSGTAALSVYAVVPTVAWKVFVELPAAEARAPLWRAVMGVAGLMGLGVLAILLASLAVRHEMLAQPVRT